MLKSIPLWVRAGLVGDGFNASELLNTMQIPAHKWLVDALKIASVAC